MQRIVDRSETTAGRKRCPQMVAIWIEISISYFSTSNGHRGDRAAPVIPWPRSQSSLSAGQDSFLVFDQLGEKPPHLLL